MQSAAEQFDHDSMLFQVRVQSSAAVLVGASPCKISPVTMFTGVWPDTGTVRQQCAQA